MDTRFRGYDGKSQVSESPESIEERRAQVAQMQISGRAGCEAHFDVFTGHSPVVVTESTAPPNLAGRRHADHHAASCPLVHPLWLTSLGSYPC